MRTQPDIEPKNGGVLSRLRTICCLALLACFLAGCQTHPVQELTWKTKLAKDLPVLGHRNWIVIADSAYPDQISPGVETIYTGGKQLDVLKTVLDQLSAAKHVKPVVYLDSELNSVPESLAPGVETYRTDLEHLLQNRTVNRIPHEELIAELDKAGRTFRVLILKTDLTIPYTSVFLQLDCGYWGPEQEKQLRSAMQKP